MFDDFFVRVPLPQLRADAEELRRDGLAPEIAISGPVLKQIRRSDAPVWRRRLGLFRGHTLHAPFIDMLPGSIDSEVRRAAFVKMRKVMDLAADWGSRLVVMHANYDPIYYRHRPEVWLERAADFFSRLLEDGAAGPLIAVENIADPTPDILLQLTAAVNNPRLIHCFDFGHHHVFGRLSFPGWLARLPAGGPLHFHLHDNSGGDDEHLPLGRGTIDWKTARGIMAGLARPFTVTLEPHGRELRDEAILSYRERFLDAPVG
jgi:sugar phosphate isomerase/epimerase